MDNYNTNNKEILISNGFSVMDVIPYPILKPTSNLQPPTSLCNSSSFIHHSSFLNCSLFTIFNCQLSIVHFCSMQLPPDRQIFKLIAALRGDNGLYPEVMREDQ